MRWVWCADGPFWGPRPSVRSHRDVPTPQPGSRHPVLLDAPSRLVPSVGGSHSRWQRSACRPTLDLVRPASCGRGCDRCAPAATHRFLCGSCQCLVCSRPSGGPQGGTVWGTMRPFGLGFPPLRDGDHRRARPLGRPFPSPPSAAHLNARWDTGAGGGSFCRRPTNECAGKGPSRKFGGGAAATGLWKPQVSGKGDQAAS